MAVKPSHPGYGLFKHYRPMDAGTNIYIVDGQVTTVEPDYEFVTPEYVYLGGHINLITDAEASLLTAAGYTVFEGVPAVQSPPLPGNDFGDADPGPIVPGGFGTFGDGLFGEGHFGGTA